MCVHIRDKFSVITTSWCKTAVTNLDQHYLIRISAPHMCTDEVCDLEHGPDFFFLVVVKLLIFCFGICKKNRYDLMGTFVYHHKLDSLSCDTSHGRGIPPLPQNPLCPLMICPPWTTPSRTLLLGSSCQLLGEDDSVQRKGTGRIESEGRPNLTPTKERTKSIGEGRRSLSRGWHQKRKADHLNSMFLRWRLLV